NRSIRKAACSVDQKSLERRETNAAAHSAKPVDFLSRSEKSGARESRPVILNDRAGCHAFMHAGAGKIRFEAEYHRSHLVVVAKLRAPEHTTRFRRKRGRREINERRCAGKRLKGGVAVAPTVADVQADIKSRPTKRGRWWRLHRFVLHGF